MRIDANDHAATLPKVRILGCPARDEADELALDMFRHLLESTKYEVEAMSDAVLASEVVDLIGECSPAMIFIATVSPGGLGADTLSLQTPASTVSQTQDRGRTWGMGSEDGDSIRLAGADRVGTTMIETREQMIQLCQTGILWDAQSGTSVSADPATKETIRPEVAA